MNFPHNDLANTAPIADRDFRAILANIIASQASSHTGRAMNSALYAKVERRVSAAEILASRIGYFAAGGETDAAGAFLPDDCLKAIQQGEEHVYHSASAKSKASPLQDNEPGNPAANEN